MVANRIRVASLQYFVRPVRTFDDFRAQVEGLVETAADYRCQLVVFPEIREGRRARHGLGPNSVRSSSLKGFECSGS